MVQAVAAWPPGAAVYFVGGSGQLPAIASGPSGGDSLPNDARWCWRQCRQPVGHQSDSRPGEHIFNRVWPALRTARLLVLVHVQDR
eukprot:scaffold357454_cov31-Prasinocladus_malaysianus.AAC.2